jgi:hypothetical protein
VKWKARPDYRQVRVARVDARGLRVVTIGLWPKKPPEWALPTPEEERNLKQWIAEGLSERVTLRYAQWQLRAARDSGQPQADPVTTTQPELIVKPTEQPQTKIGARRGRRPYDFGIIESKLSALYEERGPPSLDDDNSEWRSQADVVRWVQNEIGDAVGETTVKKFVSEFDADWKKSHYRGGN